LEIETALSCGSTWRTGPFKNVNRVFFTESDPGIVCSRWVQISGIAEGESINDMVVRDQQIFLATNTGVLISRDGGANWANWSEGMSSIRQVTRIVRSADGQRAFCGEVGGLYGRRFAS
jgi:photosystem II stability/assembly factor-like uncharacterized protein